MCTFLGKVHIAKGLELNPNLLHKAFFEVLQKLKTNLIDVSNITLDTTQQHNTYKEKNDCIQQYQYLTCLF